MRCVSLLQNLCCCCCYFYSHTCPAWDAAHSNTRRTTSTPTVRQLQPHMRDMLAGKGLPPAMKPVRHLRHNIWTISRISQLYAAPHAPWKLYKYIKCTC